MDIDKHTQAQIAAAVRKGREDGRRQVRAEAEALEDELIASRHGHTVALARGSTGVSQTFLDRLVDNEDTVLVPVQNMDLVRKARADLAQMQVDQWSPANQCHFCAYLPPRGEMAGIKTRRAAFARIIYGIADQWTGTLGDPRPGARKIVQQWNRFIKNHGLLSAAAKEALLETETSAMHHFFDPKGCIASPSTICADRVRRLLGVEDDLHRELYVQRVVHGVPMGAPVPDPVMHRMLLDQSKVTFNWLKTLPSLREAEVREISWAPLPGAATKKAATSSLARGISGALNAALSK